MSGPPRLLRVLLCLYPAAHRRAYGQEMWAAVRHRFEAGRAEGPSRLRLTAWTAADLSWSAAKMWTRGWRGTMTGMTRGWGIDLRFVARTLRRTPGYALTAVVVLAGAVAVDAAVFSFVRGTLLARPHYPGADRIVVVWGSNPVDGQLRDVVSGPNYIDLRASMRSLEALSAFHSDNAILLVDGRPTVIDVESVSVDFFDIVPVQPYLGRVFEEGDRSSSAPQIVLVSWDYWQDVLGGDAGVIGRSLPLDGEPHTIVGVLPEGFEFVREVPLWRPLRDDVLAADERTRIHYHLFGRLRPGATPADATRDLTDGLAAIRERTGQFRGWAMLAEPLHEASVMAVRPVLVSVAAAVTLVLLIALVNLATLFRIRAMSRSDELAVRLALGGGRGRIARVLALEVGSLALMGAAVGLAVAPFLLARVREMVPLWIAIPDSAARVPVLRAVLDPQVALGSVLLAVVGAVALAAPSLVTASRRGGAAWAGRGGTHRGTRWLVIAELALATVLCVGAGLTTRSAERMLATDVGLEDEGLLTLYFGDVWERPIPGQVAYFEDVVRAVEGMPGVASAGLMDYVPFEGEDDFARIYFLDSDGEELSNLREQWRRVGEGAFETAGMRVLSGRLLEPDDFRGTPRSVVVNESFARKHYPEGRAVGELLSTHNAAYRDMRVVGVVADLHDLGPATPPPPMLYVPLQGDPRGTTGMFVRVASGQPLELAEAVREAIWSVDPSQPVDAFVPMTELVGAWVAIPRATRSLVSALAAFSLILAALGVFGVVAYAVRSRTAELGIRLALGASPRRIEREMMGTTAVLVGVGVALGLAAGALAGRAASALLFQVRPLDPISLAGAAIAMLAAALFATWLPARRAGRVDPREAIRAL